MIRSTSSSIVESERSLLHSEFVHSPPKNASRLVSVIACSPSSPAAENCTTWESVHCPDDNPLGLNVRTTPMDAISDSSVSVDVGGL